MILLKKVGTDIIYVLFFTTRVCKEGTSAGVPGCSVLYSPALHATAPPVPPTEKVGLQKDGSIVLPDSQVIRPAGRQITVLGRPSVIAIRPDHKTAVVINGDGNTGFAAGPIEIIDLINGTVLQQIRPFSSAKVSLTGAVYSPDGQNLYASDNGNNSIDAYQVASNGTVTYTGSVNLTELREQPYPGRASDFR